MEQTQDIKQYCLKCKYNVLERFQSEEITLKQARAICANCKFGKAGIYKFDIVFSLADTAEKLKAAEQWKQNRPKGKKDTYTKRYGTAIKQLQEEGKTVRQIAEILGISAPTIVKITKKLKEEEKEE